MASMASYGTGLATTGLSDESAGLAVPPWLVWLVIGLSGRTDENIGDAGLPTFLAFAHGHLCLLALFNKMIRVTIAGADWTEGPDPTVVTLNGSKIGRLAVSNGAQAQRVIQIRRHERAWQRNV
jgi:hypothetical protein